MIIPIRKEFYKDLYINYLNLPNDYDGQIKKDITRTFKKLKLNDDEFIQKLFNVLHVLACDIPEIGYLQGMNLIVGYLLIKYKNNEIKTFKIMSQLIKNDIYGLNSLFAKDFPKLFLTVYQVDNLLEVYLPKLHYHFKKYNIDTLSWLSSWVLTLFTKYFEEIGPQNFNKFFDIYLEKGWITVIKFIFIVLKKKESTIIELNYDATLIYLNEKLWKHINLNYIDELLDSCIINNEILFKLEIIYMKKLSSKDKKDIKNKKDNIIVAISSILFVGISSIIFGSSIIGNNI